LPTKRLTVEPATEAHAAQLAEHIRAEDAAEMMASHGLEPLAGVLMALKSSSVARTILDGERVVAMLGVAPVPSAEGVASIWLLAARLVRRVPLAFMRAAAGELRQFAESWRVLFNMVLAENRSALKWVRAMGFEVFEPVPFGVAGRPFHPIRFTRSV
jgi:hypothetical protein